MTVEYPEGQVIQGQVDVQQPAAPVQTPGGNNLPARREDFEGLETGLDDLSFDEIPTPRIKIKHSLGVFSDNQTDIERETFKGIILGFQRQRIMWDSPLDGDGADQPKCKSNDGSQGLPNTDPTSDMTFPFEESSFDPNSVPVSAEYNRVILPCDSCNFKDWTRSRGGKNVPPRCSEVFNLIVMFDAYETGHLQPAFMPLKKSSLKNVKGFLARYKQQGVPAYTDFVEFSLQQQQRGDNTYSVPVIKAIGPVQAEMYEMCSENYTQLRNFATRIRVLEEGPQIGVQQRFEESPQQPTYTAPQQPQAPQPAPTPAPSVPQPSPQTPPPQPQAPQPQQSTPASPQIPQQQTPQQQTPQPQPAAPAPASPPPPPAPSPAPVPQPAPAPVAASPAPPSVPTPAPPAQQTEAAPQAPQPVSQEAPAQQAPTWETPASQGDDDLPF